MVGSTPDVTVVIPVGGVEAHLVAQLAAVLGQSVSFAFEVVLSVNSAEATVVRFVADAVRDAGDARVRIVDASQRRSAAFARNRGVANSDAAIIAFCDADDEVAPLWLATLVRNVDEHHAVGGMLSESRFSIAGQSNWRPPATPGELPMFLGVPYMVSANMAISRDAFERVGGFDETLVRGEDIALSWELDRAGVTLLWEPGAVVHYRHRSGVAALVKQHYLYGVGMSQVLKRHGIPNGDRAHVPHGAALLRPNGQRSQKWSWMTVVRRASVAAGRVAGLVQESRSGRSSRAAETVR